MAKVFLNCAQIISGFQQSGSAFLKAVMKLDRKSGARSWTAMIRSIKFLDWMDSVPARFFAGREERIPFFVDFQ